MIVTFPVAHHNVHGPDRSELNRQKSNTALILRARHGIGSVNELNPKDRVWFTALAKKHGLAVYIHDHNALLHDPKIVHLNSVRVVRVMTGGHVGADGVATPKRGDDDRRVGPHRYVIIGNFNIVVDGVKIGDPFEFDVTHLMARSFTLHKWRIPLFRRSVRTLTGAIREKRGVLVGDMNSPKPINLPGMADVNVPAGGTFGKNRYDQIIRWGTGIKIDHVKQFSTPSDHDGVQALMHVTVDTKPQPDPDPDLPPTPAPPVVPVVVKPRKYNPAHWHQLGAPVKHPFAPRTRRWKRRHHRLWQRILAFRRKWRAR